VVAAGLSATIGTSFLVHKARRVGQSLESRVGLRFFGTLVPPLVAGAALTAVFVDAGLEARLPGLWLLSYGVAVTGTGNISLKLVTWAGVVFMALGLCALAAPAALGDLWMALGFGGAHMVFGWQIARRHDG